MAVPVARGQDQHVPIDPQHRSSGLARQETPRNAPGAGSCPPSAALRLCRELVPEIPGDADGFLQALDIHPAIPGTSFSGDIPPQGHPSLCSSLLPPQGHPSCLRHPHSVFRSLPPATMTPKLCQSRARILEGVEAAGEHPSTPASQQDLRSPPATA